MIRFVQIHGLQLVRHNSTISTISGKIQNDIRLMIDQKTPRAFLKQNSNSTKELVKILDVVDKPDEIKPIKRLLMKKFKQNYSPFINKLRDASENPTKLHLTYIKQIGQEYRVLFNKYIDEIISNNEIDTIDKKNCIYEMINLQNELYPTIGEKYGWFLTDKIHKWFWENIDKNESFTHYYFLIQNNVNLSSSYHILQFQKRLLKGSQLEFELASFQLFLHKPEYEHIFRRKFIILNSFDSIRSFVNLLIQKNDLRFLRMYFNSMLDSMKRPSFKTNPDTVEFDSRLNLIYFNISLLNYLSKIEDIKMFSSTLRILANETSKIQTNELNKDNKIRLSNISNLLLSPLSSSITLLRNKGMYDEAFDLLSLMRKTPMVHNSVFKNFLIGHLISCLRSFNDPKLSLQYVTSAYRRKRVALFLNQLGLWGWVYHGKSYTLSNQELDTEYQKIKNTLPRSMVSIQYPPLPVLTELYITVLNTFSKTMDKENFKVFLLDLYQRYKKTILPMRSHNLYFQQNTGILNAFLKHVRYSINDHLLSLTILKDFYNESDSHRFKPTDGTSPFSIVVYQNEKLSNRDISKVLELMDSLEIPLDFKFCVAMVYHYHSRNNIPEALVWYKKILDSKFNVEHMGLIKLITENGWEYPDHFDMKLLENLDEQKQSSTEEEDFLISNTKEDLETEAPTEATTDSEMIIKEFQAMISNTNHVLKKPLLD
ncbi:hypothetical protein Kpol_1031p9 [Vanderwaltozyma polyspora DSM 70294]|uniref:Mitochondrial translation factor ATP22 n=1 Tax=Vanderwaltozyma polyspora (strain ATCC 22028 / DSM 70294 / BCRC 21397 / CBS 2163 / NBRC 10782 / NRRL Y-8283 / UCD 57-17) TaxID=436907 RepID=ATP22_VANPO|nr:uncharacterized protein Kpol_1031p9 [Vanderwaltozyma polyspora DSM 70294]A7THU3.1 RecName: Full=Mitochondrial translation factor ATP22; Flags: Precursor [Vanderwaltozyma polyspora DSM 70294]EDO18105.1 hypothetical protein Kpol_1031p9 [Vanderwaltozyma polyspora DSM 70294]